MKECKIMGKQENLEKTEKKSAMESAGAKDPHRYDDMLFLPHHVSSSRPPMSMENRAAQFSPFAALTGYGDVVKEAGRWTEQKIELDETEKEVLDRKLRILNEYLKIDAKNRPLLSFTYYLPDEKKEGGSYVTETGVIRRIDPYQKRLILFDENRIGDGTQIPVENLLGIEEV